MDINQIKDGMRRVDCQGEVFSVGDAREVNTKRGPAKVADARLRDKSGEVGLSLWDDEIERVAAGSFVKITNAMANSYRGALQLSVGQYGKMEVAEGPEEEGPPPLTCASCGFSNAGHLGWRFCPVDGEALG